LLDSVLGGLDNSVKSGYTFQVLDAGTPVTTVPVGCALAGSAAGYGAIAVPVTVGTTGQRSFCSDASGVIRFNATGTAAALVAALCPVALGPLQ
jgi:hypothetical protein